MTRTATPIWDDPSTKNFPSHDKTGKPVKLPKPLTRLIRSQHPKNDRFILMQGGTHKCIENLAFEFRDQKKGGHWEFVGADPIKYERVENSWIKNVYIRNADHGISISKGKHISIVNIFLDAYTLRGGGGSAIGHMGICVGDCSHLLIHNVKTTGMWIHDMVSVGGMKNVVWSRISGPNLKLDHHSQGGMHDLYTEIDHGKGSRPFSSSKLETYWGPTSRRPIPYSEVGRKKSHAKQNVVVGMKTNDPSESGEDYWWESIDPAKLEPKNIYIAQLKKVGKPLPDYPMPEKPIAPDEPQVFFSMADATAQKESDKNSGYSQSLPLTSKSGDHQSSAYIKFDLRNSGIQQAWKAVLKLYGGLPSRKGKPSTPDPSQRLIVHAVSDDNWEEHTLNATNAPESGEVVAEIPLGTRGWHDVDVTDYVNQQLQSDQVLSLRLTGDPNSPHLKAGFNSSDAGDPPHLIITPASKTDGEK
jgi:hypothetical protein